MDSFYKKFLCDDRRVSKGVERVEVEAATTVLVGVGLAHETSMGLFLVLNNSYLAQK